MCICSPVNMSSHCHQSSSTQGPPQPALGSGACQSFWEEGDGRWMQVSLSNGFHFTSCQNYSHLSYEGSDCNSDSLHLTHIMRVHLCHLTFYKKRKKAEKANNDYFERGICEAEDGGCGCEQAVPSAVWRPGRKGAPASRQHKR